MSFPWDGWYAAILPDWPAPAGAHACAGEPFTELSHWNSVSEFDSVQFIPAEEYDLVRSPAPSRTLTYLPESRQLEGVVYQLNAKLSATERVLAARGS